MAAVAATEPALFAHARMIEESPTGATGEAITVGSVLEMLESGQVVNCTVGDDAASTAQTRLSTVDEVARRRAAEVLAMNQPSAEIVLAIEPGPLTFLAKQRAVIDFTDATGTYCLTGTITEASVDHKQRLTVVARSASLVQLRRFVRVPVLIPLDSLLVQAAPGEWRTVNAELVDLSLGGLGLLVSEPMFEDAHVQASFELPGRFGELNVRGRVVCPPGPAEARVAGRLRNALAYRRGVAFDPLSAEDLRRLQRALYYRQVELRKLSERQLGRLPAESEAPAPAKEDAPPRWQFWRHR